MSSPIVSISALAHAARRHRRRADADAAGHHRRIRIERDGVLVDRDAGLAERRFGDLAGEPFENTSTSIRWLSVPPLTRRKPRRDERRREPLRVRDDLPLVRRRTPARPLP